MADAKSYTDPSYDALDADVTSKLNLPPGLLSSIRTNGERSSSDQVSSAGARSVYQITPATRKLAVDKFGIDPYLSDANAALVAGKLLQESLKRNNGSVPQAVGEYIGGTDRANWGPTTNAYIKRVTKGLGGAPSTTNPYAAKLAEADQASQPEPDGPSIDKLVTAYNSGAMDDQAASEFKAAVDNGAVMLPRGTKLKSLSTPTPPAQPTSPVQPAAGIQQVSAPGPASQAPAAQAPAAPGLDALPPTPGTPQNQVPAAPGEQVLTVPPPVAQAYIDGKMDAQAATDLKRDLESGAAKLPDNVRPTDQGVFGQLGRQLGLFGRDVLQGTGETAGIVYNPIAAVINKVTGSHINNLGDQANQLANSLGLPNPAPGVESVVNKATEAGSGGLGFAKGSQLLAKGTEALAPTVAKGFAGLGAGPIAQTVASTAGGAAQEQAKQAGAGPVVQTAANVLASLAAPTKAAHAAGTLGDVIGRGAAGAAERAGASSIAKKINTIVEDSGNPIRQSAENIVQNIPPKDVLFDEAGNLTKEGREFSIWSGLNADSMKKALGTVEQATKANTSAEAVQSAEKFDIPLTKGEATRDFATQDKEQSLLKSATPEGDAARQFFDSRQEKINQAVDNFRSAFGNTTATAAERGDVVQQSLRDMKASGQAGVRAMYGEVANAAKAAGTDVPIDAKPIVDSAYHAIVNLPTEAGVKSALETTLAKYGLIPGEVTGSGPFRNVVTSDGQSIRITGDVTPLTLQNAEDFRKTLNSMYNADRTGGVAGVISKLDEGVENAVATAAQRGGAAGESAEALATAAANARAANKVQQRTFNAKDVISDLTSYKNGTFTPKVLDENTFTPLFNNPSNLRKAKNVLLTNDTDGNGARAWQAVQAQALAHIADGARNPQTGDITAQRLNSQIAKFGDEQLRTLFNDADYGTLKALQAHIAKTQPLSGTVNYSNTFTKFANLVGKHLSDTIAGVGASVAGAPGMLAGKGLGLAAEKIKNQNEAGSLLKDVRGFQGPAATLAAQKKADKANRDLIDTIVNASRKNVFVPYGLTHDDSKDQNKQKGF